MTPAGCHRSKTPLRPIALPFGRRQPSLKDDYPRIANMLSPLGRTGLLGERFEIPVPLRCPAAKRKPTP